MRLVLSLALLFLTSVVAPTLALPSTPVICDVARLKKHTIVRTGATRLSASSTTVTAGGTTTISLQGGFTGFLLYVIDGGGTHVGTMTATGANVGASSPCVNGAPAGTTVGHNSATTKTAMSWTWKAPSTPGTYQAIAMVAESAAGVPPVFQPTPVTITVQAAQPAATPAPVVTQPPATQAPAPATQAPKPATNPPATNTNPNPKPNPTNPPATNTNPNPNPNPNLADPAAANPSNPPPADTTPAVTGPSMPTIQQLLNTVLVRLQAALSGNGNLSLSQLKKLIKELQTAVQKAKTAKGSSTANQPVQVVVTKATPVDATPAVAVAAAAAVTTGSSVYSVQLGFGTQEDAQAFADSLTDKALRGTSTILDGEITSQLQYDPTGLDAAGNVVVAPVTVDLFTCTDGTQVPLDQQATCAAAAAPPPADPTTITTTPAPAAGANTAGTTTTTTGGGNGMSNGMFLGLLIGGIALLLLGVGGLMYYQKVKDSNTVKPRV